MNRCKKIEKYIKNNLNCNYKYTELMSWPSVLEEPLT